jgi:hypothetical protein
VKAQKKLFFLVALALMAMLAWGPFGAWGQKVPSATPEEGAAEQAEEPEKVPPPASPEAPEYFPLSAPASPVTVLELSSITTTLGPTTGVMAPYGNAAAYDTLLKGWQTHKVGVFRVVPFLEYDGIYRSNIFHTSTDKKADFVHAVNPGLRLDLPLAGRHKLSLGYLGNYFMFSRFSNLSHYDHNVSADATLNFRGGLNVRLGNAFRAATEEPSAENARKRPYLRDTPYVQAAYSPADKWQVQGFYQFDVLNFKNSVDRSNDYREQAGGATFSYKFWPKTGALVQYIIASRIYPDSSRDDSVIHTPLLGLTWDPTAKLSNTVKFGYSFTDYGQKIPGRNNSPGSFIVSAHSLYRYSRYTNLAVTVQRSKQDDVDFGNSAFWNTGIFMSWSHDWHYFKTATYATFSFINNSYINDALDLGSGVFKRREDNIIYLGAGLSRPFTRWLKVRLDWSYLNNSSNFSGLTYNEHRVLMGLQTSM